MKYLENIKVKLEDFRYEWRKKNITEKYKSNFKGNCLHFFKIIPFFIFICTYFLFILKIPNLISDFTYDISGFLLLFAIEIVLFVAVIVWILYKFKISRFGFFVNLFAFKIVYFIPIFFLFFISSKIFKQEIITKNYVGLSKYEKDINDDMNGKTYETLATFPNQLFEASSTNLQDLQNQKDKDGEDIYISQNFYFWQTSIIYGYDISNIVNIDNIEYSRKVLLNLSLFPLLIIECLLDAIPMVFMLIFITLICYLFNYRFPFSSYDSLRKYINKSSRHNEN